MSKVYNKKNECPVCGKKIIYVKITKENGKITHRAIHETDEMPINATKLADIHEISPTYRKRLRDAIQHVDQVAKPVFDATGMNRIVMVTEVVNLLKDAGMTEGDAKALRSRMLAKGNGFVEDIEIAAPCITIIRN
jgi:hypothetical protein